jgi:hypothetical protein
MDAVVYAEFSGLMVVDIASCSSDPRYAVVRVQSKGVRATSKCSVDAGVSTTKQHDPPHSLQGLYINDRKQP